jgi:putative transposase
MVTERYHKTAGSVSTITYHLVWCVKYRKNFLTGKVEKRLKQLLQEKANELECEIVAVEVMPDHVHLFVTALPIHAPQHLANQFKGYTSRVLRQEFDFLRTRIPSLWSRSYYVGSAGHVSADTIQKYIEAQKSKAS